MTAFVRNKWPLLAAGALLIAAALIWFLNGKKATTAGTTAPEVTPGQSNLNNSTAKTETKPVVTKPIQAAFNPSYWSKRIYDDLTSFWGGDPSLYNKLNSGTKTEGLLKINNDFNLRYADKMKSTLVQALEDEKNMDSSIVQTLKYSISQRLKNNGAT